jgi:hypothetical protein
MGWLNSPLRFRWPNARRALKAAALGLRTVLATPFTFDYDMMLLAPAIAFFAADGLPVGSAHGRRRRWPRSG